MGKLHETASLRQTARQVAAMRHWGTTAGPGGRHKAHDMV